MGATLRPHGLTHVQFVILASSWWLTEQGMAPSQGELADHAGTDLTMTGQALLALERRGLVARQPDPEDARIRHPGLTEGGRRVILRALPAVEEADLLFLEPLRDRDGLTAGLSELTSPGRRPGAPG
jgi:DNA-binding MarR family transcriptional regulator